MQNEFLSYPEFVSLVIEALQAAGIEYMVGGALALWAWGEPRSTMDLDLMINVPVEAIPRLSEELKARDMLLPPDIILDAIIAEHSGVPLNAIHMTSGFKADLYLLFENDDFGQSAFRRQLLVDLGPRFGALYVHSPEDLIIFKLWYYRISRQTKHPRDIFAILSAQGDQIDYEYIQGWVEQKGLSSVWEELLRNRPNLDGG
jgi:hypothetical protein